MRCFKCKTSETEKGLHTLHIDNRYGIHTKTVRICNACLLSWFDKAVNTYPRYIFDFSDLTLNSVPMQTEDVAMIISRYHHLHPNNKLWNDVIAMIVGSNYTGKYESKPK